MVFDPAGGVGIFDFVVPDGVEICRGLTACARSMEKRDILYLW
jgi:hypothetical protein